MRSNAESILGCKNLTVGRTGKTAPNVKTNNQGRLIKITVAKMGNFFQHQKPTISLRAFEFNMSLGCPPLKTSYLDAPPPRAIVAAAIRVSGDNKPNRIREIGLGKPGGPHRSHPHPTRVQVQNL